jgi:signal transduction histidine kinase
VDKILFSVQKVPDNFSKIIENSNYSVAESIDVLRQEVENNKDIYGATIAFEPYLFDSKIKYYAPYCYRNNDTVEIKNIGNENYDYFSMDWYNIPKELNRPVWSEPYLDEGGGNIIMSTYSVPLYRQINGKNQFIGILTADVSLDWLQDYFDSIKVYQTGYAFMISRNGAFVSHPKKELIINESIFSVADKQKLPQLYEIGQNMIKGESSFVEIEFYNLKYNKLSWIAYAPVTVNGWSVGVVFPVNEFQADINNLFVRILVIGLVGLIIICLIVIFISRSITSPLRRLSFAANKFAEGDFNVELPSIKSNDEIGRLNKSFISMQDALSFTINDLKETSNKLKVSNEKLEEYSFTLEEKVNARTIQLKETNIELDYALNNVKMINEFTKKITSTLNIEIIQNIVYENVNMLLEASRFFIMIYNEKEMKLECKNPIEKGVILSSFDVSMDDNDSFAVWCVKNAKPILINDVENEYKQYVIGNIKSIDGEAVGSIIYLPMMIENRVTGVISVHSVHKNAYTQHHLEMLSNLANYVAMAFDNAISYKKINKANVELKAAQTQLVQSEKMASLGQLTAGIAHEIKNPLNFVNNFAELTVDLAKDLTEEIDKLSDNIKTADSEYLHELINDISANATKINAHGKRADSIVRGMLLHSRGKTGEKQPTDINTVLAEYINLGYHGMRAQDSSFNIKIETDFDNDIGLINVASQDLSRVFLNIINNACYSTHKKKIELKDAYFPILCVQTKNLGNKVEIRIKDNGLGIPQEIIDKVFNPFFTTKPAGQGTGLGLSLSYDIVVLEHHGEIKVLSKVHEFAEFIIIIPKA